MMKERADLRRVRLSKETESYLYDAIEGSWGQVGEDKWSMVLIKNVLFVNLREGCKIDIDIPTVYDGFILTNKNRVIEVKNSHLTAEMGEDENGYGQFMLKKWN
jgi:hypothetical protein